METLLSQLRRPQPPLEEVREQTREIRDMVLTESKSIRQANFSSLHSSDLEMLFELYDEMFFDCQLGPAARGCAAVF